MVRLYSHVYKEGVPSAATYPDMVRFIDQKLKEGVTERYVFIMASDKFESSPSQIFEVYTYYKNAQQEIHKQDTIVEEPWMSEVKQVLDSNRKTTLLQACISVYTKTKHINPKASLPTPHRMVSLFNTAIAEHRSEYNSDDRIQPKKLTLRDQNSIPHAYHQKVIEHFEDMYQKYVRERYVIIKKLHTYTLNKYTDDAIIDVLSKSHCWRFVD